MEGLNQNIFIYAGIAGEYAKCYVALTKYGEFNLECENWEVKTRVHPATKKQRDTFLAKVKEANIKEHS